MKRLLASAAVAGMVVVSIAYAPPAKADDCTQPVLLDGLPVCLEVVDGKAVVTLNGEQILTAVVPPVVQEIVKEVPVYINVPGPPGPTVEVPTPVTVTRAPETVERTRTVEVPGPTVTATVTAPPAAPSTVTETKTVTATPTAKESNPSATMGAAAPDDSHRRVTITVVQAVTYSLLAIFLGCLMVLLGLYAMFRMGRAEGERSLDGFLEELRQITYIRKS